MNIRRKGLVKSVLGLLAVTMMVMSSVSAAMAQGPARNANWTVSITYQNIGNADSDVTIDFYQEGSSTPLTLGPAQLPASNPLKQGAATSFFVGSINNPAFTEGNAVMRSNEQLAATVVQFSPDAGYRMRLLYNGFPDSKSSTQYLVATTLKNRFARTTVFSVQNTENEPINVTINFYDADNNGQLKSTKEFQIPANSSKFIELDNVDDTGISDAVFNGSAIITAKTQGGADAEVVAAASEYYVDRPVATNFEGQPLSDAGNALNMATALCQRFGLDTYYAIQNASLTDSATIQITYYNLDGSQKKQSPQIIIGPGQKHSAHTCNVDNTGDPDPDMSNFTGSAVITSQGAPIVAIGKAQAQFNDINNEQFKDVLTAFLGETTGYQRLALPFVRWGSDERFNGPGGQSGQVQRTFIAIQNVGNTEVSGITIKYNDKNGQTVAQVTDVTIPPKSKFNTDANTAGALGKNGMNPNEFGYYTDGSFGGGVIIEAPAGAQLIAIARVQHPGAGEDYNAVPIP